MPLRIAFDLDGVLADMDAELVRQSEILFGEATSVRPEESAEASDNVTPLDDGDVAAPVPTNGLVQMTGRRQRRLWQHVRSIENFWEGLEEIEPGAVQRLAVLALEHRWEIIFLTRRPDTAGATAQMQTQRWLQGRGFALPSVFVVRGSRGRIAAALGLDIVVDDLVENCLDVIADSKARSILVWRGGESQSPETAQRLGIGVVKSVADCLDVLTKIEAATREEPSVMSRVMRLLGIKEPAAP